MKMPHATDDAGASVLIPTCYVSVLLKCPHTGFNWKVVADKILKTKKYIAYAHLARDDLTPHWHIFVFEGKDVSQKIRLRFKRDRLLNVKRNAITKETLGTEISIRYVVDNALLDNLHKAGRDRNEISPKIGGYPQMKILDALAAAYVPGGGTTDHARDNLRVNCDLSAPAAFASNDPSARRVFPVKDIIVSDTLYPSPHTAPASALDPSHYTVPASALDPSLHSAPAPALDPISYSALASTLDPASRFSSGPEFRSSECPASPGLDMPPVVDALLEMMQMRSDRDKLVGWTQEATERFDLFADTIRNLERDVGEKTALVQELRDKVEEQGVTVKMLEASVAKLERILKNELLHHVNGHAKVIKALTKELDKVRGESDNRQNKKWLARDLAGDSSQMNPQKMKKARCDDAGSVGRQPT
jgi:hypothetical protein